MHGFWFLIAIPLSGVLAWRLGSAVLQRTASLLFAMTALGICGWFGFLVYQGAVFTETFFDRVMHGMGVVVASIDIPVMQLLAATVVAACWPKSWIYRSEPQQSGET